MVEIQSTNDLALEQLDQFDDIIDVRSPAEYQEDHIPGAINLPVLSDQQRSEVGTVYKQRSRFEARRLGAQYVTENIAAHLATYFTNRSAAYRPLLYCWRGGMRSESMATILSAVGWRCTLVEGGYRTWRRLVHAELYERQCSLPLVLLDGRTGSGKTELLQRLKDRGTQIIDLEGLAGHRGSIFGGFTEIEQPSQKMFETNLYQQLMALDTSKPIMVEAESRYIGRRLVPVRLMESMLSAPWIEVRASADSRTPYLVKTYSDVISTEGRLASAIEALRRYHDRETIERWRQLEASSNYPELAGELMREHYDPLYDRHLKNRTTAPARIVEIEQLTPSGFEAAVDEISSILSHVCSTVPSFK